MTDFQGKRVLITGADSTARVVAETLALKGAKIFACDLREEAVHSLLSANPSMHAIVANVADEGEVNALFKEAIHKLGGIDVLINVVGIAGPTKPAEEITALEWQDTMNVNINGVFYTARAVIPGMKERGYGSIVNFSTASTKTRLPNRLPYITSKYAIEGLTLNLARELGPFGIRANAILPGAINNERLHSILEKRAEQKDTSVAAITAEALQYISMRTLIDPQEIADTVAFICSDKAKHITGQLIGVDGNAEWEI